jgi:hypothetical protein
LEVLAIAGHHRSRCVEGYRRDPQIIAANAKLHTDQLLVAINCAYWKWQYLDLGEESDILRESFVHSGKLFSILGSTTQRVPARKLFFDSNDRYGQISRTMLTNSLAHYRVTELIQRENVCVQDEETHQ